MESDVSKFLSSAVHCCRKDNRIVLDLDSGSYILSKPTGKHTPLFVKGGALRFNLWRKIDQADGSMAEGSEEAGEGDEEAPRMKHKDGVSVVTQEGVKNYEEEDESEGLKGGEHQVFSRQAQVDHWP